MDQEETIDKSLKNDNIPALKEWLEKQPHLPHDIDKELLTAFIYGTKSLEQAKKRLDKFFTIRGKIPKLFQNPSSDPLDEKFRDATLFQVFYLPQKTPQSCSSIVVKYVPKNMDLFSHTLCVNRIVMLMELGMHFWPESAGLSILFDLKGLPKSFLTKMNPPIVASYFAYFQDAYPIKLKKIIIFNNPTFINVIVNALIKPFVKQKVFDRLRLHQEGASSLSQYYDVESLPSDYGGKGESTEVLDDKWYQLLVDHRDWLKTISALVSDETKRPPDEHDTYGVQGTFRTLKID